MSILICLLLLQDAGAKKIEGGITIQDKGLELDIPKNWKKESLEEGISLIPPGANPNGVLEEAYLLISDPELKEIQGEAFEKKVDGFVGELQAGSQRRGKIEKRKFGDLDGCILTYRAETEDGKTAEIRVHAFQGSCVCALVTAGYPDVVAKRNADLDAILGSIRKSKGGNVRQELAGSWFYMTNVNANDGGRATNSVLTLQADGSYTWRAESNWSGPNGFGFTAQAEEGKWSVEGETMILQPNGGKEKRFELERRNHPKNVRDPMIVLDGQCFVTTTQREPWK